MTKLHLQVKHQVNNQVKSRVYNQVYNQLDKQGLNRVCGHVITQVSNRAYAGFITPIWNEFWDEAQRIDHEPN